MNDPEMEDDMDGQKIPGGLGAVKGIRVSGVSAGFRRNPERRDLALIVAPPGSRAAGVFTQSNFAAAPVLVSKEHLAAQSQGKGFRALVINSGNANAATASQGMEIARKTAGIAAGALGCDASQVLVASTGVIGVKLALGTFKTGIPQAVAELGADRGDSIGKGIAAAEAIMTTDTVPKTAARSFAVQRPDGSEAVCTVGGMAKGSGMIAPHMATMIAVLATDAMLEQDAIEQALKEATAVSFNKVTIDSDTSTNDSAYLIATGAAIGTAAGAATEAATGATAGTAAGAEPGQAIKASDPAFTDFLATLTEVCQDLACQIARDGEGATRLIVVDVTGAVNEEEADLVARAIADSPLVKTAVAGHDANWGRIAMAAGKAGATFRQADVSISILGLDALVRGAPVEFPEEEALRRFEELGEVHIAVDLGAGEASTRIWTCDLTKEYVEINGDYRT